MSRKGNRLTEQRLVPFEAPRDVAYPYDGPRALHQSPLPPNSCLVYSRNCRTVLCRQVVLSGCQIVGDSEGGITRRHSSESHGIAVHNSLAAYSDGCAPL